MSYLPSGLPYYLRNELNEVSPNQYIDSIFPKETLESANKDETRSKTVKFITFFIQASEDREWLKNNPEIRQQLLDRAIFIFKSDMKYKDRFQGILEKYSPVFKQSKDNGLPDDLTMSISGHIVKGSSKLLSLQSDFFQKMLLGESSFRENKAFREGKVVEIEKEYPELVAALISSLDTFKLDIPEKTSIEEIEYLIQVSGQWMIEASTFPMLESELIKRLAPENATYLYFLASEMKMQQLSEKCLEAVYANLDDKSCIEILDTLKNDPSFGSIEENQPLVNCCVNYMVSRLPEHFKTLGDKYDYETSEYSDLQPDEDAAAIFLEKFKQYAANLTHLEDSSLHKLNDKELEWVLSKLSPNLKTLNLSYCPFKNLVSLAKFSELKNLQLKGCKNLLRIDSVKSLKDSLKHLDITDCTSLKNFSMVAHLKKLDSFFFQGCTALSGTAIKAIERFPNLESMKLRYSDSEVIDKLLENIAISRGWDIEWKAK